MEFDICDQKKHLYRNIVQRPQRAPVRFRLQDESPLFAPSQLVTQFDVELQNLLEQMIYTMEVEKGIGIAAPQIGESRALFVIDFPDPANHPRYKVMPNVIDFLKPVPRQVFVNPHITKASSETVSFWHACLSAVGLPRGKVATYRWIEYWAQDINGREISGRLENMAAVIFQHEFRHLLGLLYYDQGE